jgi:O-antigen ligase
MASGLLAVPGAPTEPAGSGAGAVRAAPSPARSRDTAARSILLSPRSIPGSLFSFEALLLLYMFAGMYKGDPRFDWIPVDETALFFALSVLVGSFIIVLNPIPKRAIPVIWAMLALVAWWAVTLTWSPSQVYGPSKVFYLATLVLWGLTAGALIVAPNPERIRRLFTLLLLFAIWVGIDVLLIYGDDLNEIFQSASKARQDENYEELLGGYQHIGRICGLGALVAFTAWLFGPRMSAVNYLLLVPFAGLAFVVTASGAKISVVAIVVPILLALLLGLRVTRRKILYRRYQISIIWLASALVAGLSIYVAATDRVPKSLDRLAGMIEGGELQGTAAGRATNYADALEFWSDRPLVGHGAGSWTILQHGRDSRDSPHNQFLEALLETGLVGLVLLIGLFVVGLRPVSLERLRNDPLALCALMLFVHEFLAAMVGGDIAERRIMFMLLGVLTLVTTRRSQPMPEAQQSLVLPLARQSKERTASPSNRRQARVN